jgi:hypothetical protein
MSMLYLLETLGEKKFIFKMYIKVKVLTTIKSKIDVDKEKKMNTINKSVYSYLFNLELIQFVVLSFVFILFSFLAFIKRSNRIFKELRRRVNKKYI